MATVIEKGVVQGLFNEIFDEQSVYVGTEAAPFRWVDFTDGSYYVAVRPELLRTEEEGFDPMTPLSREAPSRPARDAFDKRDFSVERYSEHYFIDDITLRSVSNASGIDLETRAARVLAGLHRGRHERFVAQYYADSNNYGDTDTAPLSSIFGAIEEAAEGMGGADRVALVVKPSVLRLLRQSPEFAAAIGGGNTDIVGGSLQFEEFLRTNYGLDLIVGHSRFVDNRTTPGTNATGYIWEETPGDWLSVVGLSRDTSAAPSFVSTVAFAGKIEDPSIAQLWVEDIRDPRGTKVISESVYDVAGGDPTYGVQLTIVPEGP